MRAWATAQRGCCTYDVACSPQTAQEALFALLDGAMLQIPKNPALGYPNSLFQRFFSTRSLLLSQDHGWSEEKGAP